MTPHQSSQKSARRVITLAHLSVSFDNRLSNYADRRRVEDVGPILDQYASSICDQYVG